MKNIDEQLVELEEARKRLLEKKAAQEKEAIDVVASAQEETVKEEPRVIIQSYLMSSGPVVNIQGDLVSAQGLLTYMNEYVKMIMQRHIINSVESRQQAEEAQTNENN